MPADDMKNTIQLGDKVRVEDNSNLTRNDVVGFTIPGTSEQKFLRIVGIPGDTVVIDSSRIYINGKRFKLPDSAKEIFLIYCKDPDDFEKLTDYDFKTHSLNYCFFSLDRNEFREIKNMRVVDSIYPIYLNKYEINSKMIESSTSRFRNKDYFGPLIIPRKNEVITSDIIKMTPTFLQGDDMNKKIDDEFYFCVGDNFTQAEDSRELGLIPKKAIKFKVIFGR